MNFFSIIVKFCISLSICILFCKSSSSSFLCASTLNTKPADSKSLPRKVNGQSHSLHIVTSFSILKEWVDVLTKGIPPFIYDITHETLVSVDQDPHTYHPTPKDSEKLLNADLIFKVGSFFEGWLDPQIKASGTTANVIGVSTVVEIRSLPAPDPHIWHDVSKVRVIVRHLAEWLSKAMPNAAPYIRTNATDYDRKLRILDSDIKKQLSEIPRAKRKIITTHDAFYYYGQAYDVDFFAPMGFSTEVEPDSKTVITLIRQIKDFNIQAIFFENLANRALIRQIAKETGLNINEKAVLYADSLSHPAGEASDYESMIRHNTKLIISALKQSIS